jgi:hypothetical protein
MFKAQALSLPILAILAAGSGCRGDLPTGPAMAGPPIAERAAPGAVALPLKLRLEGVAAAPEEPERCAPPLVTVGLHSTGTGTFLGRFTGVHSQCIDPTGTVQDPLAFTDGRASFTAANGDVLHTTFAGTLIPTSRPGVFVLDNPVNIVGGTGRFAGARGTARARGVVDLTVPQAPFSLVIVGSLMLPRPN